MQWQAFGAWMDHSGQKESKEQQLNNKQQMVARTSKNSKAVFVDEGLRTGSSLHLKLGNFKV